MMMSKFEVNEGGFLSLIGQFDDRVGGFKTSSFKKKEKKIDNGLKMDPNVF